mgnify:CR=1 FL=1
MKTFKLDKNNNIELKAYFITISGKYAIIQDIKTLLLMFKTEYPFNTDIGLPWYDLASFNNKNKVINAIKERILEDDRIQSVNSLNVDFKGGKMQITMELNTIEGEINV